MIRKFFRAGLAFCLGGLVLIGSQPALANVEAAGSPLVASTLRQWGAEFTRASGIRTSYVNSLEDVSTTELFVGIYDLAVVEFPVAEFRLNKLGLLQFPLFGFGVAVVANVPGLPSESLRFNGNVLAAIYMGQITHWDDPKIVALNPGINLPHLAIVPVAQSDGSITTLNFTRYLAAGSASWRQKVGIGSGLIWPLGDGEKDSIAAAQTLKATDGAIGFQPMMNLARFDLGATQLQNEQGDYVTITSDRVAQTFRAFVSHKRPDLIAPVNVPGSGLWPILAVVYGQMKQVPEDIPDAMETVQFLTWALKNMPKPDASLGMVPVAYDVVAPTLNSIQGKKTYDGRAVKKGGGS